MREAVARFCPDLLERALDELRADPFELLDRGTDYLQPAVYCASIAGWRRLHEEQPEAVRSEPRWSAPLRAVAGHSLGELAALAAAGVMTEAEGLDLAIARGRLMARAATTGAPGAMLAVSGGLMVGGPLAELADLTIANDNSPDQVVLSGAVGGVHLAMSEAKARGERTMRLPIRGAFHSPAMQPAVDEFRAVLSRIEVRPPRLCVYSCLTAKPFVDVRVQLVDGLTCCVKWRQTLLALFAAGVGRFIEAGPGSVLTGLVRRTLGEDAEALTLDRFATAHA
jgi:acyl transferase domain-containing protein